MWDPSGLTEEDIDEMVHSAEQPGDRDGRVVVDAKPAGVPGHGVVQAAGDLPAAYLVSSAAGRRPVGWVTLATPSCSSICGNPGRARLLRICGRTEVTCSGSV
jgi:hypothetical protein